MLSRMLRWQLMREFRCSQSTITRVRDPQFKAKLIGVGMQVTYGV
jgi:hypothetical protein